MRFTKCYRASNIANEFSIDDDDLFSASNIVDIILSRGGIYLDFSKEEAVKNLAKSFICEGHIKELSTQWRHHNNKHIASRKIGSEKVLLCSFPAEIDSHDGNNPKVTPRQNALTKDEAKAIYNLRNINVHPGIRKKNLRNE